MIYRKLRDKYGFIMKITIVFLFLFPTFSFSQISDSDITPKEIPKFQIQSEEIFYQSIFEIEDKKSKLHSIGLKAISELYRSSKSAIDLNDLENGVLIVKANLPLVLDGYFVPLGSYKPIQIIYTLEHVLILESKDQKVRVTLDRFKFISGVSSDGEVLTFNPPNNLDQEYLNFYQKSLESRNLKKRELANLYNKSLVLNELNNISLNLMDQLKQIYFSELNDDW